MRTWGQALIALTAILIFKGGGKEFIGAIYLFCIGGYLWINGQKRLDELQAISDQVKSSIRNSPHVNMHHMSLMFDLSERNLRLKIVRAQKKGWLPKEIDMR